MLKTWLLERSVGARQEEVEQIYWACKHGNLSCLNAICDCACKMMISPPNTVSSGLPESIPIVHTSLSQLHICFEAFCAEPRLVWFLLRAINAQKYREVSDIADGPFKLAEDKMDRMASVKTVYSSKSASITAHSSLQAALDVTEEAIARDVRSTTLGHCP